MAKQEMREGRIFQEWPPCIQIILAVAQSERCVCSNSSLDVEEEVEMSRAEEKTLPLF